MNVNNLILDHSIGKEAQKYTQVMAKQTALNDLMTEV